MYDNCACILRRTYGNRCILHLHKLFHLKRILIPGIHIHPEYPEKLATEIENYSKKGVRLAGELVPYLIGYCSTYLMEGYYELFDLCMQNNMVISIHKPFNIDECGGLAKRFKGLTIVVAHPGYNEDYLNILEAIKKYDNLFLDLSGTGIAAYGMLRHGINIIGANKILFDTDFPG